MRVPNEVRDGWRVRRTGCQGGGEVRQREDGCALDLLKSQDDRDNSSPTPKLQGDQEANQKRHNVSM